MAAYAATLVIAVAQRARYGRRSHPQVSQAGVGYFGVALPKSAIDVAMMHSGPRVSKAHGLCDV